MKPVCCTIKVVGLWSTSPSGNGREGEKWAEKRCCTKPNMKPFTWMNEQWTTTTVCRAHALECAWHMIGGNVNAGSDTWRCRPSSLAAYGRAQDVTSVRDVPKTQSVCLCVHTCWIIESATAFAQLQVDSSTDRDDSGLCLTPYVDLICDSCQQKAFSWHHWAGN